MNIRKESVKIVILNTSDRTGGAAVAAGRLGKALEQAGIQVDKLVRKDTWLNPFPILLGAVDYFFMQSFKP